MNTQHPPLGKPLVMSPFWRLEFCGCPHIFVESMLPCSRGYGLIGQKLTSLNNCHIDPVSVSAKICSFESESYGPTDWTSPQLVHFTCFVKRTSRDLKVRMEIPPCNLTSETYCTSDDTDSNAALCIMQAATRL